jgi:hypothetical protein
MQLFHVDVNVSYITANMTPERKKKKIVLCILGLGNHQQGSACLTGDQMTGSGFKYLTGLDYLLAFLCCIKNSGLQSLTRLVTACFTACKLIGDTGINA